MNIPIARQGDLYLLFHHLPYDFEVDLPLPLGPGVCLDRTPQDWLDSAEKGLADYILPGYNFEGSGLNNCCLRCFSRPSPEEKLSPENLNFLSLLSLRLHLPLPINIAGQFRLGDNGERITEPVLYELASPWSINSCKKYTPSVLAESTAITERLINIERLGCKKLITGINYFSHVSLGRTNSFQLSYLGLFAALEALFVPSGKKAVSLSKRISKFLSNFKFPELMDKWIRDEYINGRHKLAHGIDDAAFYTKLRPEKYHAFGRLHEITRLSLLGFLSLESEKLIELSESSGNSLQQMIDNLNTAHGKFLIGQQCWAS
jgi:hypothetical protein